MKRLTKLGLLTALFLWGLVVQLPAQSTFVRVVITLNDGTEETYDMLSSSYMYFEEGQKLVITEGSDGMTSVSYPLADIRKLTCQELEGTPENTGSDISFYPNPVHDQLHFRNVTGQRSVHIYAMDGRLVKSFQITDNQTVDITDLPKGLYLINISFNTYKMLKL